MRRRSVTSRTAPVLVALVALVVGVPVAPAVAEPPPRVEGRVADRAGVLDRAEQAEVETALERLETATTMRLTVVFVAGFDPPEQEDGFAFLLTGEWAEETARRSGLGRDDVLLAVATREREYEWDLGDGVPLTGDQVEAMMERDVVPVLAEQRWADAAVAAARGLENPDGPWWRRAWVRWTLVVAAVVGVVVLLKRAGVTFWSGSSASGYDPHDDHDDHSPGRSRRSSWSGSSSSRRSGSHRGRSGGGRF
ncbi:MAG: TPM domain-containing protein [Kineosporiaceae bacterium]